MEWHIALIIFGLLLSAAGIVFGAVFLGYSAVRAFKSATAPFRVGVSRLVVLSCAVFLAVGGMRISCLSHQRLTDDPSSTGFSSAALALGQGVLHTLQTFSLDEEYENSVGQMENLVLDLSDGKVANPQKEDYGRAATVAASVATMLTLLFNCAAPIAGGAVIFEILAALFPKLRLLLLMTSFFKKKVYFSELNDRSLALMKSILAENSSYFKRPVIVFTDAYSSDMDEHSSELLEEARVYGAVCVKDDLANIPKSPFGQRIYFLIDEDEEGNLKAMAEFCTDKNLRAIRGAHVYVFTGNDDTYLQVERRAREALLRTRLFKKGEKLPVFIPVQSYRNLVINLFNEIPLYEPLVCKKQKKGDLPLTLTVFGCGEIGMETVLAAYWYGQMGGVKLKINVVSREDEDSFYRRLDRLNPEIRKSMKEKSRILRYGRGEGEYCPAYCTLKYLPFDLEKGEFGLGEGGKARDVLSSKLLQETDYFVVALGSDEDNVALAEKLRRYLSVVRLKNDSKNEKNEPKNKRDARKQTYPKAVIAYAVYESALARMLNEKRCYAYDGSDRTDIYMYAFGSLNEVYGTENVYMTKEAVLAGEVGQAYSRLQRRSDLESDHGRKALPDREKVGATVYGERYENVYYNNWADRARAFHVKYKVFSLGWIDTSVFDGAGEDKSAHDDAVTAACARYKDVAEYLFLSRKTEQTLKKLQDVKEPKERAALERVLEQTDARAEALRAKGVLKSCAEYEEKKHLLAWLEHRRWVAFTRTRGFQNTDDYGSYLEKTKDHKYMSLKLHPCLREYGMWAQKGDRPHGLFEEMEEDVNKKRRDANLEIKDFREYDYLVGEFSFDA